MSWDGMTERRRHRRAEINLVVEFASTDEQGRARPTRLETLNLSAGGFYCDSNREIPELTRLGLRLVFPPFGSNRESERSLDCEAVVVRCERRPGEADRYRFAACFMDLSPESRDLIEEFVEWHSFVFKDGGPVGGSGEERTGTA